MENKRKKLQSLLDFRDNGGGYTVVRTVELPDGSYVHTFTLNQYWFSEYSLLHITQILREFRYTISIQEGEIQFFVED